MTTIEPGTYTVSQLLSAANFDFRSEASADYLNGEPDYRRVTVGGLPFSDLEESVVVPHMATEVEIRLDGKQVTSLEVDNGAPKEDVS